MFVFIFSAGCDRVGFRRSRANTVKNGVPVMVVSCLVLVWMFGGQPAKKVEPIPTDGLIEAMQPLSKTLRKSDAHEADFGNMDPQPSPSDQHEKAKREIIIFTRPNCPPCDRWKRCEQAKFEADGWTVAYCDDHDYPLTPTFLIDAKNKQIEHRGYLPFEKISEVVK